MRPKPDSGCCPTYGWVSGITSRRLRNLRVPLSFPRDGASTSPCHRSFRIFSTCSALRETVWRMRRTPRRSRRTGTRRDPNVSNSKFPRALNSDRRRSVTMLTRCISKSQFRTLMALVVVTIWLCGLGATNALAADNLLYSLTNNSPFNVYTIDTSTGAATSVGNLSFASAAIARQPSTGLIYYAAINTSGGVYRIATWNPTTNTNTTLSGSVNVYLPRLTFKADGTLYGMDSNNNLYTLNTNTGAINTTSGPITGGGLTTGLGGDIAFSPTGTLYLIADTNLYAISGTTSTLVGATGASTALAGLAFATDGSLYTSDTTGSNSQIYKLSTTTGLGTLVGSSGAALSDLAALPAFADLAMTKTATSGLAVGQNATY